MMENQDWTIGALLEWTANFLAKNGSEFPRLDSEVLLAHSLGCRRIELYTRYQEPADNQARDRFRSLVRQRLEGCPVAYLVGRKEFFALEFLVGPDVLIPRPESEFVVMECLRLAKLIAHPRVLDIGTGSGNLAIAVAHGHPGAEVTAVDLSPEALAVAQRNADKHGVRPRITFLLGDLFAPLPGGERFNFILSNPPYIPTEDIPSLPVGVRNYEPRLAVDGGTGGFVILDRLLAQAGTRLEPGGYLIVEVGARQVDPVRNRIQALPGFQLVDNVPRDTGRPAIISARRLP